jgi:hypothetical protein
MFQNEHQTHSNQSNQSLQREDFTPEELMKCMGERLGTLSIDAIEKLGLPQPDIVIPKVSRFVSFAHRLLN